MAKTRSLDQARAVLTFLDAASEKTLRSTVALTAARGRGKSAALGLAVAGALGLGYSNIFVTAPSPENLRTLFEFVVKVPSLAFDYIDCCSSLWSRCLLCPLSASTAVRVCGDGGLLSPLYG